MAPPKGRVAQRQARNRGALIEAGYRVMSQKGVDAATMQEIAELADVGAGTVNSYFRSKEELAGCVMERVMRNLALRIESVTDTFADPAQVCAFGARCVREAATGALGACVIDETVVRLLCMTGVGEAEARELANRPRPALPPESPGA